DAPVEDKAQLIETAEVNDRIRKVLRLLTRQLEILKMRERINSQIKEEMGKNQREYVLRQQLKPSRENAAKTKATRAIWMVWRNASPKRTCRPSQWTSPRSSSSACARCRSAVPSTPSCGPTSTGSSTCRGPTRLKTTWTSRRCARFST